MKTRRVLVRLIVASVAVVLLGVIYLGITLLRVREGLPQWEGQVEVAGLDGPVEIVRDEYGTPHITARSELDLYYAQGFVHAQDRFWQMALMRQASLGRMAEWVGGLAVPLDRRARAKWVVRAAERSLDRLPEPERSWLEAYAAGVNAWLNSTAYRRPPEFIFLHVRPEQWRPLDTFLVLHQLHEMLASAGHELVAAVVRREAVVPGVSDILEPHDEIGVPTIISGEETTTATQATAAFKDREFSNSWVVSGAHTASGYPLLANDPQLAATLPNYWQFQHHALADRAVVGASIPGLPGIVIGHNGAVAWGMTNSRIDVNDFALLEQDSDDPNRFRYGPDASWFEAESKIEKIRVRFGRDVVDTVRATPNGIIWPTDLRRLTDEDGIAEEHRYQAVDVPQTAPAGLLRLNQAATVEEALEAIALHSGPSLSFSVADTAGAIGYVAAGRLPSRPTAHATTVGLGPNDSNARTYLDYSDNPRVVNPASGRIVTANQRIIGDGYPHYLTDSWAAPDRALRIHELLDARETHDLASFRTMQVDPLSPVARRLVPLLLTVQADEADRELVRILEAWDYRFTPDSPAPSIFLTWVEMLNRRIVDDELGPGLVVARAILFTPIDQALRGERRDWCDNVDTDPVETCETMLARSLSDTRAAMVAAFGPEPTSWLWSRAGALDLRHGGLGTMPVIGGTLSRTAVVPGGPAALFNNVTDLRTAPSFHVSAFTSSFQVIYDLSDLESSEFMMVGGASGHHGSPFYNNLTSSWVAGERIPIPTDMSAVAPIATLSLVPERDR